MNLEEKGVKVKMSICPECGNSVIIAIEHRMTEKTKKGIYERGYKIQPRY